VPFATLVIEVYKHCLGEAPKSLFVVALREYHFPVQLSLGEWLLLLVWQKLQNLYDFAVAVNVKRMKIVRQSLDVLRVVLKL
jgi:hypothetical protein